ncbi:MAG: c-type cytochrome, partial [Planctomycetales bacterium]|nr:c-type cytochrome [Planctomycetales bacterium]
MDIVVDRSAIKASDRGAINDTRIRVTPLVRILFISFVWIEILGLANSSYAQTPAPRTEAAKTLTEQLLAEGANSLAVAARERGDAVRGAILFSQQTLACAGCHAQGAKDLLGPDLTVVSAKMTDEHFVESILLPSKVIGKGFESVKVLTIDGRVVTGRMVDDSDDHVVIRELAGTRNLTRITKDQIDRIGQDAASAMPEKLADHLADRQQFLDLVKYVIDIAGTNANIDLGGAGGPSIGTIDKHIQGLSLLDHFGCINCHATHSDALAGANALPQKRGPILDGVTNRVDPAYIRRFIASPQTVKRGTSMPNVIGHLDDARRDEVAAAITAYLVSRSSQSFERQAIDSEAAGRGQELFHTVGCVACHSPRDDQGRETMTQDSVALGDVGAKHNLAGLTSFLEDPHSIRPEGRMPNMTLSHWEAQDLANYLMQFGEPLSATSIEVNESTAALGKQLFEKFGCSQCHRADSGENPNVALPSNAVGNASGNASHNRYPSLAELDPMRGCLSAQAGSWPRFQIDDSQIDAIRTAIGSLSEPLGDRQRVVLTMETLRCFACHRRDDLGGISDERDVFFHTTNENLGPQGRIPPSLTGVGGKLKQKWLRDVLVNGRSIRPYMNTRMPQFGLANVEPLMDLFPKLDPKPLVEYVDPGDLKETKTIGTDLVGNQGLNCIACHTFAMQPAQTMPAVDLTEMAERLNKEWFIQYMYAPQVLN